MLPGRRSIQALILVPVAAVLLSATLGLGWLVHRTTSHVSDDYLAFAVDTYGQRVRTILDTAVAELRTANLLGNPLVEEAKQRQVIEGLSLLWADHQLDGLVVDSSGKVLFTSLPPETTARLAARRSRGFLRDGDRYGTLTLFTPWNWTVLTLLKPATPVARRLEVTLLLPLVAAGCALMLLGVFFILRRNFHRPMQALLADLAAGRPVRSTGVAELDTIGRNINDALGRLEKRTEQYQLLHNLAVSVHEMLSVEDLLKVILGRAKELLDARIAAVALCDAGGGIAKLFALPPEILDQVVATPLGKAILRAVSETTTPLCVEDLRAHPAFSASLPPGTPQITNLLGSPIFSPEGRPVGALYFANKTGGFTREDRGILQAISADAAIAIAKAENLGELRRFRAVVESSFDAILVADAAGTVRYANPAFETLTGYPREAVIGLPQGFLGIGALDAPALLQIREAALGGGVWKGEISERRRDGESYSAAAVVFAIHTDEGASLVSIQRELTQEKRLAEQLLRAQKMEAIGTLASGIAHDFNNILAGILGYAEFMMLHTSEGDPFRKAATVIGQAAERGAELTRKILMVARKEQMELHVVDLNALVLDSMELLRGSLPRNVELALSLGEGLPRLQADPTQLHQIVMNLVTNARDAMPEGGRLTIETAVAQPGQLQLERERLHAGGYLRLSVSDTGIGMDEETQRRVYDPFFTTKKTGRGTGLGLFIVHTAVGNHGGLINLYSEQGQGTRISVYLPVAAVKSEEERRQPTDLRGSGKVLVIDDEPALREVCTDLLQSLGYAVLTAGDGEEGLRVFREARGEIGVVILDMIMPGMGGAEVYRELQKIRPDARVVLCSGYSQNGYAGIRILLAEGAAGFVQKPFTLRALGAAIKDALAAKEAP